MTPTAHPNDQRFFRTALSRFPTGVTVVLAQAADGSPIGLTISSFSSLSLEPPLVLWTLKHQSSSLPHIEQASGYVIHVLSASQTELAYRFARGPQNERFEGVPLKRTCSGLWMLDTPECAAWFECSNHARHDAGDHAIFIGAVTQCAWTDAPPLIHHSSRFHHHQPAVAEIVVTP